MIDVIRSTEFDQFMGLSINSQVCRSIHGFVNGFNVVDRFKGFSIDPRVCHSIRGFVDRFTFLYFHHPNPSSPFGSPIYGYMTLYLCRQVGARLVGGEPGAERRLRWTNERDRHRRWVRSWRWCSCSWWCRPRCSACSSSSSSSLTWRSPSSRPCTATSSPTPIPRRHPHPPTIRNTPPSPSMYID